ncbi:MAG: histidine phosphatase family protein [Pseudomonadota bacterium]
MPLKEGITLHVVRHGQTDWNKLGRLQGQTDIPINDLGRAQAAGQGQRLRGALADDLDGIDFVSSPLLRTAETMEILREAAGLPRDGYRTDARLMEIKYGTWEGAYLSELKAEDPDGYRERNTNKFRWRPTDGESYADLSERIAGWLEDVRDDAVVVTHGGVTRVLRGLVSDVDESLIPNQEVPQDRVLVLRSHDFHWLEDDAERERPLAR